MSRLRLLFPLTTVGLSIVCCVGTTAALAAPGHRLQRHLSWSGRDCVNMSMTPNAGNLALIRLATLCLVNRERVTRGERALKPNARLRRAAASHTHSMAVGDYFEHVGPGGQTPLARMRAFGYISSSRVGFEVGENIAFATGYLDTPAAIVAAWMASPGHRANILDGGYRETGLGVSTHPPAVLAQGQAGAIYTQDFGVIITR